ncbi:MAG: CehA/McbA family metallohydrolase [Saprospiraceae bacterium]|nr:CehA/McbA family metallohydrolase [Saprospiraceae bacterium]
MKNQIISSLFIVYIFLLLIPVNLKAHPGQSDEVLQELNDYLMAIQLLRIDDEQATAIFATWHQLRTASWKIRALTDEQDLLINADVVMEQISETKLLQKKLLQECRDYFAELITKNPSIRFNVNESIHGVWNGSPIEVQLQHSKVVLIEVINNRKIPVHLFMHCDNNDEILFWNKHFVLDPGASRFTFAVCAPQQLKVYEHPITIRDNLGNKSSVRFQVKSVPIQEPGFALIPGDTPTKVILPAKEIQHISDTTFRSGINFSVRDKISEKLLTSRIEVKDAADNAYWFPVKGASYAVSRNSNSGWRTPLWDFQPGPFFYIDGQAVLGVSPKNKFAKIYCGFEYIPVEIAVPENGIIDVDLERWINMPDLGWYSGQTHIHTTDVGMPVHLDKDWPLVTQGEDLHVSAILTLKGEWETHAIYANEFPMGKRETFSTTQHIITYGEEFRNNPYGHLAFMGLKELIQPISTGALGELGGPDYPPNAIILEEAMRQGATTIAAHFGNFTRGVESIETPWPSTGFEMPVDIALGNVQLAEIYGNGGQLDIWYDILNCGFRVAATAGPDWTIKDSPRVYVQLDGQTFTLENWRKGLEKGQSFITRGPMLFFEVDAQVPGSVISVEKGPVQLEVSTEALMPDGKLPVEILFNGKVLVNTTEKKSLITIDDSGWIAARCEGAHSNPIYVDFAGRAAGYAEPAERFISIIDRLADWVKEKGLFDTEDQKKHMLDVIDQGREVYRNIINRATTLDRKY